jgi:RpiR family glv operon transcriptional regulator
MEGNMRLEELFSAHYESLNASDKHIWNYVGNNKALCSGLSIEEVAERCNVSRSTIMRFAQKLGLTGYSELKTYLRWETTEFARDPADYLQTICDKTIKAIERFRDMDMTQICRLFHEANRVFVYGTGSIQRAAAGEFKRMFLSLDILVENITGEGEFQRELSFMGRNDVVLIISKKGNSNFIKDIVIQLKSKGVRVISLTFSGDNTLANMSDYQLFLSPETVSIKDDMLFESLSLIFSVIEILCIKCIQYMGDIYL